MSTTSDLELQRGLQQLGARARAVLVALLLGAMVAVVAVSFFEVVVLANGWWQRPLPSGLSGFSTDYHWSVGLALLLSALAAGWLLVRLNGGRPHGPADLIDAAQHDKPVDQRQGMLSSVLALINLSGGASVGIFEPLVHLGGCLGAWLQGKSARLSQEALLGAGAGAAIAAVFSAPIGAAIFAHEAILRRFGTLGPGPVLACTFSAFWVSRLLLGEHRLFRIGTAPALDAQSVLVAAVLGVLCGLLSMTYIWAATAAPKLAAASRIPLRWRPLVPAALLFALSPVLPHLLGAGMGSVKMAMAGQITISLLLVLVLAKIAATVMCLGFGYFGGVFAPALFFGSMLGALVDALLATPDAALSSYVALGAAGCVATVIGAPAAAVVIVFEMTGSYSWAVLSMITVVIAAQISRSFVGRSLFDRQLAMRGIAVRDDYRPGGGHARPPVGSHD